MPRLRHGAPVAQDALQEHELPAAAEPLQEGAEGHSEKHNDGADGDDESQVAHHPGGDVVEGGWQRFPSAQEGVASEVGRAAPRPPLTQGGQEGAEAQDEPLLQVEG